MARTLLNALAALFVLAALVFVANRLVKSDWTSRPSEKDIGIANEGLVLPSNSILSSQEDVSKMTFVGVVKTATSDSQLQEVVAHFVELADRSGWRLKRKIVSTSRSRLIYCAGKIAHDIEISSRSQGGTSVRAGSYWFADKGDDRFCR